MNLKSFKHILFLTTFLICTLAQSQNESAVWYFGEFAGLDFNSGNPVPLTNGQLVTKEGCATISDASGALLFYTDGKTVWDRQHQVMPNGTGLLGDASSTESSIIIPKPGAVNEYYIFTVDKPSYFLSEGDPITGVNYSKVDMNLNNGMGDVVAGEKNIHLITYDENNQTENEYKCSEKITAVTHSDGSSIWVITQFINKFYAFNVDYNGVNSTPVVSSVQQSVFPRINEDGQNVTAIGYLKVSPNGKKIAIAHSSTALGSPLSGHRKSGKVLFYDFNNTTGTVSNQRTLLTDEYPYGIEFSPNSKLLYVTSSIFDEDDIFINSYIYQYDTEASNIEASQTIVSNTNNVAGALQLAIDGKIYRSGYPVFGNGDYLSVINNPNDPGSACNYSHNSLYLEGRLAYLGLPPFIQSIFKYTFDFEFTCLGDNTHFFVTSEEPYDTLVWDFGDGSTSTQEDTYHTYQNPGTYDVSLTLSLNGVEYDPFVKQLIISEPPEVLQDTYQLMQCDSFDADPNDGITTFNLEDANAPISLYNSNDIRVFYYHTLQEALDDTNNLNALDTVYTNQALDEILYAKVIAGNSNCYSIATVQLVTTQSVNLNNQELFSCDYDNSGTASFDLQPIRDEIIYELNLTGEAEVTFHTSQSDAAVGINPIEYIDAADATTVFIRVENNNACYGSAMLQLNIVAFPTLENQTISVCHTDFPIVINSGLDTNMANNYNFLWDTNQTSEQIEIYGPGNYLLNVIDPVYQCENTLTVHVSENQPANIQDIIIDDFNVTVVLDGGVENFEFAVDDPQGYFQPNNTFINLAPGFHTVYVRDIFDCTMTSQEFNLIGFPKFFTPNNDGINDFWNIKGLSPSDYPDVEIKIFDRYGKLLKVFNPNATEGWNGTFRGHLMTPDDYWFYLKMPTGEEYSGHFSLKV